MSNTIKCELYDYFEIACMRRSEVSLELLNGSSVQGVAENLVTKDGIEFIVLNAVDSTRRVNLKDIDVLVFVKSGERFKIS